MEEIDAWRLLGIEPSEDPAALRTAYLHRLLEVHPDRSASPDANDETIALTAAYELALARLGRTPPPDGTVRAAPPQPPTVATIAVAIVADDTIGFAAPPDETFVALLEMADVIGEVAFVDRSVGMIQIVVELVDQPICQILLTMQGRSSGITEVFVTIESFDAEPPPPIDAVVRLLVDVLT